MNVNGRGARARVRISAPALACARSGAYTARMPLVYNYYRAFEFAFYLPTSCSLCVAFHLLLPFARFEFDFGESGCYF